MAKNRIVKKKSELKRNVIKKKGVKQYCLFDVVFYVQSDLETNYGIFVTFEIKSSANHLSFHYVKTPLHLLTVLSPN